MPGSAQFHASVATQSSPLLHPAARGALFCPCRGEVIEMHGQYGWLKAYGDISHPLADKHDGHVFVNNKDLVTGQALATGDVVTFYLYVDDKGLGAERCQLEGSAATPTVMHGNGWYGKAPWNNHQAQCQGQVSPHPVRYTPFVPGTKAHTMPWTMPAEYTSTSPQTRTAKGTASVAVSKPMIEYAEVEGELPSIGSVGHSDGSCKRCAFFPKGRCTNGHECDHCHFDHTLRKRCRTRKVRLHREDMQEPSVLEDDSEELELTASVGHSDPTDKTQPCDAKAEEDCHSEDDAVDAATHAPSSDYPSDDEGSTHESSSSVHQSTMSEMSDSESVSDKGQVASVQDCSSPTSSYTSDEPVEPSSPMSWSAQMRIRRERAAVISQDVSATDVTRMVRALLNKLTHERFESLCGKILALPLSTPEHLKALAAEIFEKATSQDCFRSLYTDLCMRLDAHFAERSDSIGGKTFRKVLVSECQATFDENLQPADPALFLGLTGDEPFELEMKLKTRRLGNMRFIGDLLVHRLLAQKLMPPIILELLNGDEVALESLIAFLTIVAPCFEQTSSPYRASLRDAFATLRRRKTDQGLSSRLRCHLSDLFDARARGWTTRSA